MSALDDNALDLQALSLTSPEQAASAAPLADEQGSAVSPVKDLFQ